MSACRKKHVLAARSSALDRREASGHAVPSIHERRRRLWRCRQHLASKYTARCLIGRVNGDFGNRENGTSDGAPIASVNVPGTLLARAEDLRGQLRRLPRPQCGRTGRDRPAAGPHHLRSRPPRGRVVPARGCTGRAGPSRAFRGHAAGGGADPARRGRDHRVCSRTPACQRHPVRKRR